MPRRLPLAASDELAPAQHSSASAGPTAPACRCDRRGGVGGGGDDARAYGRSSMRSADRDSPLRRHKRGAATTGGALLFCSFGLCMRFASTSTTLLK